MALYGIYGSHTTEACPLFHRGNRKLLLETAAGFDDTAGRFGIKVVAAYHSGLEHTFVWIVESEDAHAIQDLMVESKVATWNALKIVPLTTLQDVVKYCQGLEQ
jgi:hypothetical protein